MYISDYEHLTLARNAERELVRHLEHQRILTDGQIRPTWRQRLAAWLLGIDVRALLPRLQASPNGVAR